MQGHRWRKLGLVYASEKSDSKAQTHAAVPTPFILNEKVVRIFVTSVDSKGRGRPIFVDVSSENPREVLAVSDEPILELGERGCFDDNGVMAVCVLEPSPGTLLMYYVGFELCVNVRYRIFTGLAISKDRGISFQRHSRTPILDRSDDELFFRCGPFAMFDDGRFKLWYVAGNEWTDVDGKLMPVYDLRYQESKDGVHWGPKGRLSMAITGEDEHGFGRPWVVKRGPDDYQLYYSIRRRSVAAYRLGYAESTDGINWIRKDEEMGLDVTPNGFDSDAIMYSAVISVRNKTYCFYNGNNFGEHGFGVAELIV